jgi:hypothetical protein
MTPDDLLLKLLARFHDEGVAYVLIGGQAVRLNGFLRATEDVDLLLPASRQNGERLKRAMSFLASSAELDAAWFEQTGEEIENIRVADDLIVDLLFAANGETYESVQAFVREITVESTRIRVLNIDGLLLTKTDYREKDLLDKQALRRIQQGLKE